MPSQEKLTATIMIGKGARVKIETRTFSTVTNALVRLKEWLRKERVTQVAIESTGVYWRPIFKSWRIVLR